MPKLTTSYADSYAMNHSIGFNKNSVKKSSDNKTLYWYYYSTSDQGESILNANGCIYYFLGIT